MFPSPREVCSTARPFQRIASTPSVDLLAELVRPRHQVLRWSHFCHFDGCAADGVIHPHIDEIQLEHAQERIKQPVNNLGRLAATPHRRKREDAYKIVNAALEALDLLSLRFALHFHG